MFTYKLNDTDRDRLIYLHIYYRHDELTKSFLLLIDSLIKNDIFTASNMAASDLQFMLNELVTELNEQAPQELSCPFFSWLGRLETC